MQMKNLHFNIIFGKNRINIITYGLNSQAIVTISSVKDEDILICVQKRFKDIKGIDKYKNTSMGSNRESRNIYQHMWEFNKW